MPRKYRIIVLPGDGIGREVTPEAVKALRMAQEYVAGLELDFVELNAVLSTIKNLRTLGRQRLIQRARSLMRSCTALWACLEWRGLSVSFMCIEG